MGDRQNWITIEGQHAEESNFVMEHHDPLFTEETDDGLARRAFDSLSGGEASLLTTKKKPKASYDARYRFECPADISGMLWVHEQGRAWASPYSWHIDDGDWHDISTCPEMFRGAELADGGPTFAWTRVGRLSVEAGLHTLSIRVTEPREDGHFLLSQDRFVLVPDDAPTDGYLEAFPWEPPRRDDEKELPTSNSVFVWGETAPESEFDTGFRPWIEPYPVQATKAMGAVLVIPGGAYRVRAPYEGSDVARAFNEKGFHAFVLQYRVAPHTREEALADGQRAMQVLRERAGQWNVDPERIAVCGFSAGAHLSGSLGMLQVAAEPSSDDPVARHPSVPNAAILCYSPAYTSFDVREGVPENFPPSFIWHTVADEIVSVDNSLAIASALRTREIPFEMHLYPEGRHGLGLSDENPHVASWFGLCCEWLEGLGWRK